KRVDKPEFRLSDMRHDGLDVEMCVRQPVGGDGSPFDELRTGLDHLSFGVASRTELEVWQARPDRHGGTDTPIPEPPYGRGRACPATPTPPSSSQWLGGAPDPLDRAFGHPRAVEAERHPPGQVHGGDGRAREVGGVEHEELAGVAALVVDNGEHPALVLAGVL